VAKAPPQETAQTLATKQREISVSEFFTKNRHLLGFDNPRKALLTCVKEAVDNALDACEEAGTLPEVLVEIRQVEGTEDRFVVAVEDNGPGIVKEQIKKVFGKLLYGSKFHRLRMSRGQQGIGIAAAGMYGLLTTGKAMRITSRTGAGKPAQYQEIQIDTNRNEGVVTKAEELADWHRPFGTRVEIEMVAKYLKGRQSVDEYIEQTVIANPHLTLTYRSPDGEKKAFARAVEQLPPPPKEIKPHPYGIELGLLMKMLQDTDARTLSSFLQNEFSRISPATAKAICAAAKLEPNAKPAKIAANEAETLFKAIPTVRIMNPPTDVLSPIGEENLLKGLHRQVKAPFYTAVTRPPSVYRGNPFTVEVALAYGVEGWPEDELMRLVRFANRVPLLYQQGACAISESVMETAWRNYSIPQSKGALPSAPIVLAVHFASVWVPFTSESKEAVAHYPEIIREMKLAIQEAGRRVAAYIRKRQRQENQEERRHIFERYIDEVSDALVHLTEKAASKKELETQLQAMAEKATKMEEKAAAKEQKLDEVEEALKGTTTLLVPEREALPLFEKKPEEEKLKRARKPKGNKGEDE